MLILCVQINFSFWSQNGALYILSGKRLYNFQIIFLIYFTELCFCLSEDPEEMPHFLGIPSGSLLFSKNVHLEVSSIQKVKIVLYIILKK